MYIYILKEWGAVINMVPGGWMANVLLHFAFRNQWWLSSLQASAMDEASWAPMFKADAIMVDITSYPATWFGPHCQIKAQEFTGHYSPVPRLQGSQASQRLESAKIHAVLELKFKVVNPNAKYNEWWPPNCKTNISNMTQRCDLSFVGFTTAFLKCFAIYFQFIL